MINMTLEKDIKTTPLSDLEHGDVFVFDPDDAEVGDVYVMLDQDDTRKYIDFESSNIPNVPSDHIFVVHLRSGAFEHYDPSIEVIELHTVQLSYRI
jgi:hypothetical protein